jgi:hypothetical protein
LNYLKCFFIKIKRCIDNAVKKRFFIKLNNIDTLIRARSKCDYFDMISVTSEDSLVEVNENNIIVSLTTYSKRIYQVHMVIESLGFQTVKPNRIILWLDESEFSIDTLPLVLKMQMDRGLEIKFVPNFKSYKKLLPCLKENTEANIVTVDDDILYPNYFIEGLIAESKLTPSTVLGYRGHQIRFDNQGKLLKYSKWDLDTNVTEPSKLIFPTGVGGVFYPVGSLHKDVLNYKLASELASNGDDIWFKVMTLRNGFLSKVIKPRNGFEYDFVEIPMGTDISLYHENVISGGNNGKIKAVFSYFNVVDDILA